VGHDKTLNNIILCIYTAIMCCDNTHFLQIITKEKYKNSYNNVFLIMINVCFNYCMIDVAIA